MSRSAAVLLLVSAVAVPLTVAAPDAQAAGTVLFSQPFHDRTVDGSAGSVTVPTAPAGTNSACLTASGNSTKNPLASCSSSTDSQGSGKLRFTSASTSLEGGIFASTAVPISSGLDVTFNSYQYGGGGADGLAFVLAAADPANPVPPSTIGQPGGSLGYSATSSSTTGLADGYLGIGLDVFGNFSNKFEGSGCTDPSNINSRMPGQVVVRGPGNGSVGYCPLLSSAATASSSSLTLRASTRSASAVPVEVVFNPGTSPVTTSSGLTVPGGDYDVTFTPVGGSQRSLIGALPVVPSGLYPASWLTSAGYPKQLAFGWVGSTGAVTDFHEIDNVVVTSFAAVPSLSVSETSYAQSSLSAGSSVTYTVTASQTGATENQPVTITETLPSGVLPVSAFGTGWTCGAPSGQTISCTSTTSPFTGGSITVNGVVTSSGVTQATVQTATAAVSSSDASPATDSTAAAGTLPTTPTLTAISPNNGAAGGASSVTLTGTNLSNTTAIEIGTSSQFSAGTPTTLVPCSGGATTNCFNNVSSTSLTIPSMPAHAAGGVTVRAVTLGVWANISYTYNTGPALLFADPPSGEVGVAYSNQLTVTGGTSPFTWSIASGSLPAGVTLNTSTGLLSGTPTASGTFSFSVKVTDSAGLSDTKATSITIIPGPSLNFAAPPQGWTHTLYTNTLTVTGGTSPYTWSIASGSLPAGITLNASGVLTGTPTATGTFSFTVKVTDALGQIATKATTLTIGTGVTTNFPAPPAGQVGVAYSTTLTATGGTTPYTWSVNSGSLPPGLTLTSAGVLSGTPTAAGSYTFTVQVLDASNGVSAQSVTLVVNSAALSINLTASTTSVAPGGKANYTVTAQNVGSVAYTGTTLTVSLAGVLDDATYNSDGAATAGTVSFTSPNLAWTGNIAIGATVTITFSVTARNPDPGDGTLTAKVTSAATGSTCPTGTTEAHCTATVTVSGLTIVQTTDVASAAPGGKVSYTITVTNSGQTAFTGAAFSDPLSAVLDDATYGNDAAATAGTVTFSSPALSWSGSLAAGATATITFSVTVKNPDTGNGTLTSTVTSSTEGTNCPSGGTDTRCSATVTVSGLTITSTASPSSTTPGSVVSYTVTITNSGQTAFTGIPVTDGLSGVLDDATYNANASATAGSLVFSSPALTWTGNLAAGASVTVTFSVTVKNPDTGDKSLVAVITSAAPGSNCPSGSSDSRCTATVTVLVPALTITKTADVATTNPGSVVHYTITVANTGQTAYTGATFTDSLSGVLEDSAYNNDAAATAGTASYAAPVLSWTGNLDIGATATITYSVTVSNPDTGDKTLTNTVVSPTAGSNCASGSTDSRCTAVVTDLVPGLDVVASADASTATPGQVIHYTIRATNTGQTNYTGATFTEPLSGVLDDATYNSDGSATAGTVSFTSPNLTWTGNVAIGVTVTVTFSVTVKNPDTGNHLLAAVITSATAGANCAPGSTDPDCSLSIAVAQLTIVNQSDVTTTTPGGVVRYTATFTNAGQVAYNGITVTTDATNVFDDAVPNGDQTATSGNLVVGSTGVTWTGDIPVGGTVTVTGTVTVKNPDPGNKAMTATLVSAAPGNNCPSGSTDSRCSTSVTVLTPQLTITKSADTTSVVPGGTIGYTITVSNTGQTPYAGASVTDPLALTADDATYNSNAAATAGSVSFDGPTSTLTWTGNLAVGASATITYSVTVNNPDTGDKVIINSVSSSAAGSTCPPGSTAAACRISVAVLTPGLEFSQSTDVSSTAPGQTVNYTITASNTGQTPYSGISFTEALSGVLDDASYNGDASATAGSVSFSSPAVTWTGSLAVGASATITFSVTVSKPDNGNHVLAAAVTSSAAGSNCTSGSSAPECSSTVNVAQLLIVSEADPDVVTPGEVLELSSTFTNTGQVPYTAITITNDYDDVLDDAVSNGDETASSGTLSVNGGDVVWTGDIPVGGTVTITGTVTVKNPPPGDHDVTATAQTSTDTPGSNCPPDSTDPRCIATVTVLIPHLTIVKTADTTATVPGGTVGYTITVTNSGETPYTGATVSDPLDLIADDAAYNGDAAASAGTVSFASSTLTWTGNLAVGASATITYSITVSSPDTGDKTIVNTVSSSDTGSTCPPGSNDAACRVTVAVLTPALEIEQSADVATAVPGQVIHYTITATNTGQTPYTGAAFGDDLSEALDEAAYDGDASATAGSVSFDGSTSTLTWTGNLAIGAAVTVTFSVTVNNPETGDLSLDTTVSSSTPGNNCTAGSTDPGCTATVAVVDATTLTFTQSSDVDSTVAGGTVHYTITVANSGLSTFRGATFTVPLSGVLDDASYNSDAAATAGTVSFSSPNLTWTGDVPASGSLTVTYSVTVRNPDTGNEILASTLSSASPDSDCPSGSDDPRCASTVTVSQLTIDFSASTATTTPGGTVAYTATFTNTGQTPYFGISVSTDGSGIADDAVANGDETASSGTLSIGETGAVWTGDIPVGATVTATTSVTVDDPDTGDHVLTATLESAAPGSNCPSGGSDPHCTAVTDVLTPGLTIVKTADTSTTVAGDTVGYTITVTDSGETPYTGAAVTDALALIADDASYNNDAAATSGTISFSSPDLTWTGNLAPGDSATITYSITVASPDTGDKVIINSVSSSDAGSNCPPESTDADCRVTVAVLTPGLEIVQSADTATATPGQVVNYTITAHNIGQTPYTGASVSESLSGVLDDASYNGDGSASTGSVTFGSPVLTWTGDLAVGDEATITFSVTVNDPDSGDHVLSAAATSGADGSNCPSGGDNGPECSSTISVSELVIDFTADPSTAVPGQVVRLTATFTNTGQVPYTGISVTADLSDVLDDAFANGDETASSGTLSVTDTTVTWDGDIPVGGTVTVTGTLTTENPPPGDQHVTAVISTGAPGSNCPPASADPDCTASLEVLVPGLTIVKTASTTATVAGATVGYTITVTDSGQTDYTGATVTDSLAQITDDASYNGDAAATSGTVSLSGTDLTWTGDLAAGASATITYSITVDSPENGDKVIINSVSSADQGSTCPPGSTDAACRVTVAVLTPGLEIAQSTDVTTAVPGQTVHYTITATNIGQTPYTGASFAEALSGVLDDAAYNGDASASAGSVSFSSPTLTWTGNLAIGAVATITFSVTVNRPDTGSHSLDATLSSGTTGSNCAAGSTEPECASTVLIGDLTLTSTASPAVTTQPGDSVSYTFTFSNTGQVAAEDATFTADLSGVVDDADYNHDAGLTGDGTLTVASGGSSLSWTGDLFPGDSVTVTESFTVSYPDTGDLVLAENMTSGTAGTNCPDGSTDPRCSTSVQVLTPGLTITKTADATTTTPGSTVGYTITIADTGQTDYTGISVDDDLTGVLPDAAYDSNATATAGSVSFSSQDLTWTGDLAAGGTVTVSYSMTVNDPDTGDRLLVNTVTSDALGSNCATGSTDPDCTVTVTDLIPALTITKAASATQATPGDTVSYTITVSDTGETPYTGATVTDPLDEVLDEADYNGDATATSGTVSFASPDLTWTGDLAVGDTVTITYSVTVIFPGTGDLQMDNTVTSSDPGSTCPPDAPASACTATVAILTPALSISKTANASQVVAGEQVHYSIVLHNSGEVPFPAADITDPLSGVLTGASYNNDATATSGTVSVSGGVLTWTGDLGLDNTAVVSYSVTTDPSDPGGTTLTNTVTSDTTGSNCADGSTDPACTATVGVTAQIISISGLTGSFTLTGPPGSTQEQDGAVSLRVDSNSPDGYVVSVQPDTQNLTSTGTSDTIPFGDLEVRGQAQQVFRALAGPVLVEQTTSPSAAGGDLVSNDYQMVIPDVRSAGYTGTLTYIATATP